VVIVAVSRMNHLSTGSYRPVSQSKERAGKYSE
jgi:hypothetical protein